MGCCIWILKRRVRASRKTQSNNSCTSLQGGDRKPDGRRELFELFTEAMPSWNSHSGSTGYSTSASGRQGQATDKLSVTQHKTWQARAGRPQPLEQASVSQPSPEVLTSLSNAKSDQPIMILPQVHLR